MRELTELLPAGGSAGAGRALHFALRAVSLDPLREEAHRCVMRLYLALGQPDLARRRYAELERILQEELNTGPSAETQALARAERPGVVTAGAERTPVFALDSVAPSLEPVGGGGSDHLPVLHRRVFTAGQKSWMSWDAATGERSGPEISIPAGVNDVQVGPKGGGS